MVDAAAQQNRLQAAARVPGGACGGVGGQGWSSSRRALAGALGRAEADLPPGVGVGGFNDQRCGADVAWGQVACRSGEWGVALAPCPGTRLTSQPGASRSSLTAGISHGLIHVSIRNVLANAQATRPDRQHGCEARALTRFVRPRT